VKVGESPTLLGSVLACGASRIIGDCCPPWGISSPLRVAAPKKLSIKTGHENA